MLRMNIFAHAVASSGPRKSLLCAPKSTSLAASLPVRRTLPMIRPDHSHTALSLRSTVLAKASLSQSNNGHAGHAFLHDFCMGLPYGAINLLVGILLMVMLPDKQPGALTLASGVVALAASVLSLKQWKKGCQSTPFTLVASGSAAGAGFMAWQRVQAGASAAAGGAVAYWVSVAVVALSAAFSLFGVYNVVAGGNPPKKD